MTVTTLTNKINMLPDDLKEQVVDFIEFLIYKHQIKTDDKREDELTSAQKKELLEIWAEYEKNPDEAISINELRKQTVAKYGL